MSALSNTGWTVGGLLAGVLLSFGAFGLLWVGTPWPYQFLMFAPLFLVALGAGRFGGSALPVLAGVAPMAMLFVRFRDRDGSHLVPVLLVSSWAVAILLGHYLGRRHKPPLGRTGSSPP